MNESGGDEPPKFVITSRPGKLPAAVLVAAMAQQAPSYSDPVAEHVLDRQTGPLSQTRQQMAWSRQSAPYQQGQSNSCPPSASASPRERRMKAQASPFSPSDALHPASDPSMCTAAFPYPSVPKLQLQFPKEWGSPPSKVSPAKAQLPEGYGIGSVTLRSWVIHRLHGMPPAFARKGMYDVESSASDQNGCTSQPDDPMLRRAKAWAHNNGHPDVPWGPDGSSWCDYKVAFELEWQRRRKEAGTRGAGTKGVVQPSCGPPPAEVPIVPPLLLEPMRNLLAARNKQNRAVTPLSTRQLQQQLRHCSAACLAPEQQRQAAPHAPPPQQQLGHQAQQQQAQCDEQQHQGHHLWSRVAVVAAASVSGPGREPHDINRPELLQPVAHAAALTQRLMRLGNLKRRFKELYALSEQDKMEAAVLIAQRAKVVQQLRSHKSPVKTQKSQLQLHAAQQSGHHEVKMQTQLNTSPPPAPSQVLHLMQDVQQLKQQSQPAAVKQHLQKPKARLPVAATRQRLWLAAVVHACAASSFANIILHGKNCRAEAQKRHRAALSIQKMLRWKLVAPKLSELLSR